MGKRVFEVAKDLGVDHRVLLKKCDAIGIKVRNYMSVLSDADEARLRGSYDGGRKVVEDVQAPGVVRRRRVAPKGGRNQARPGQAPKPSRSGGRREPTASPRPVSNRVAPVRRSNEPSAPSPRPVQAQKPVSPRPVQPKPAAEKPAAEKPAAQKPAAQKPAAEKPAAQGAKVLYRPPAEPQPSPRRASPRPAAPSRAVVPQVSAPPKAAPKPAAAQSPRPVAQPSDASAKPVPSRRSAPAGTTPASRTGGVERRTPAPSGGAERRTPGGAQIRKPAPRESAGGAKILGRIPLEQLQRRTTRPPPRSGRPGMRRPGGPGGPGGPPRGRGPAARGGAPGVPPPGAVPPTGDSTRRRRSGPGAGGPGQRDNRGRPGAAGNNNQRGRRRRVFNREDIYRGGNNRGRGRRRKMSSRKGAKTQLTTPAAHKRVVRVDETISVGELGKAIGVKGNEILRKLVGMGVVATINQQVDLETAALIAGEYDYEVKNVAFQEDAVLSGPVEKEALEDDPDAVPRAPVVTIMGHVDHGKTTLLDRIRKAKVAAGEAGGITQHVGAYKVKTGDGPGVVFLDTPGHAAFTAMRARGASVTDIVVLIVAADDGPMPQTVESINHARAAGVPIVVAINKIDKPGVDPERIKQALTQYELVPEEWGGETMFVPVSGLTGQGVDDLLEALQLQAEVLELKANPKKAAYGRVVEARVDKGRGTVCTVLVQEGTLTPKDFIVCGNHFGRVRALIDDTGKRVKSVGPSTPVEVLGLGGMPAAGQGFFTAKNEKDAKKVVATRSDREVRAAASKGSGSQDPMDLLAAFGKPDKEVQTVILKTDVSGSLEAIRGALEQLATDEVEVKLVHAAVGGISESDVDLAIASNAVIIGFNTKADGKAKRSADQGGVEILTFSVIYDVLDTVKELLSGLLSPETVEEHLGWAEVRMVFHIQKVGQVAGCFVTDGKMVRNAMARVHRGSEVVHTGKLGTLKRFKDDVREVATGYECGLSVEGYKSVAEGDRIEVFELKQVKRTID